ncbi:MAG: D-lyxose/D-mannose family sugar isomerase [Sedimentisphaerales bacterium]|nr:D-lyxose/D-mannose family sugar isomerase [Sedimentisphaerales bacterium]
MIERAEYEKIVERTLGYLKRAHIVITPEEAKNVEVADLGLNDIQNTGLQLVVYLNTARCCAKELILFPGQTCPQHRHPPAGGQAGKEETFRCRWGKVYLYVEGPKTQNPKCSPPKGSEQYYTVWHEVQLAPGQQYTLEPNTWHWFQGGPEGAIISEFSTTSRDEIDVFSDPNIKRQTEIAD